MSNFLQPRDCSTPGFPVHHQLLELAQTQVHQVSDAIQPSHPLSFPCLPSIFPSIRVFSNESVFHIRWPKYWSFSFSISPSNEYSELICFRIDWFDLLAVQGTLKSLLQHHNSKASILQCSAFFMVQLSHPYIANSLARYWYLACLWEFSEAYLCHQNIQGFPGGSDSKESAWNMGDLGFIPGSGRSPEEENGYPLQYSCLENSMDRRAWWAIVHGVTKRGTWLSN